MRKIFRTFFCVKTDSCTIRAMDFSNPMVWVIGAVILIAASLLVKSYFSPAARIERRRRKSNSPVVSTARRPMVKFSVKTKDDDK